jgi:Transglutaminase-like superfamily
MTMPVTAEQGVRLRWHRSLAARCAAAAALGLVRLKPKKLRSVLSVLAKGAAPATAAQALAARQAVVTVSARCAGQGCLQRSVATALLCRSAGHWPDWCTGVRLQPFRAHAWVEVDGTAVGEPGDMTLYHTMLSVRAPRPEGHRP